jgi:2-dehydro-3-deoxy-D-arabinonate dehydratase
VYDLGAAGEAWAASLDAALDLPRASLLDRVAAMDRARLPRHPLDLTGAGAAGRTVRLLAPIQSQEVWAAGVTYVRSREARTEEAVTKDVYQRVYEAERPELFFKATASRVAGPGGGVAIRGDSTWDVPEPELALVLNTALEIVGYTAGNDMSSRSIEGENPLYLPQAKVYTDACALGPVITLATGDVDPRRLEISMTIARGGQTAFAGTTSTAELHRTLDDLVVYLGRYNTFPRGAILLTGTGLIPPSSFTLQHGDEVTITIASIGTLRNTVRRLESSGT